MIHSTSNSHVQPGAIQPADTKPAAHAARPPEIRDTLDTTSSAALREALAAQPEIRPETVEKAHALAVDPNYPPRAIIEDLARLFVNSQDLSNQA